MEAVLKLRKIKMCKYDMKGGVEYLLKLPRKVNIDRRK